MAIEQIQKLKMGVLVVHGIGKQYLPPAIQPDKLMYSNELYSKTTALLGEELSNRIYWREANYAHIFNAVESNYYDRLGEQVKRSRLRRLVVENLGDAATYRPLVISKQDGKDAYTRVQNSIFQTLKKIEQACEKNAPLLIIAHSLGGQVMIDYLRAAKENPKDHTTFTRGESLRRFITFGCNIPLFNLGQSPEFVTALQDPAIIIREELAQPWWLNFYDRDDVLGYPLAPTGGGYEFLEKSGQLQDIEVNSGTLLTKWNVLSHMAYWANKQISAQIARDIENCLTDFANQNPLS